MHAAELGTAVQGRKHFSRIKQALSVEGAFQALLLIEIDFRKHFTHQIALLDADAMLAGQDAAEFDAAAQDVGAEGFGPSLYLFDPEGNVIELKGPPEA